VSGAGKGRADRPSPFRALLARLRHGGGQPTGSAPPEPVAGVPSASHVVPALPAPQRRQGRSRQSAWFEPDGSRQSRRVLVMEDFLARFRQVVSRQGIGRKDPLAPVLDMLGELLVHLTHVFEDHGNDLSDRLNAARTVILEDARQAERMITVMLGKMKAEEAMTRQRQDLILRQFQDTTEDLIRTAIVRRAAARVWRDRMLAMLFLLASLIATFWFGRSWGRDEMTTALQATQSHLPATVLRDGPEVLIHWLDLMDWNRLDLASRTCAPQPGGAGLRQACTYTLWDAPPADSPPQVRQ
jgi:hypothetical protein